MDLEEIVCLIIAYAGDCRSACLGAMDCAAQHNLEEARQLMQEAEDSLQKAHDEHTKLLTLDTKGKLTEVTLLMVHASDHLSAAETVHDLVTATLNLLEGSKTCIG